MPEEHSPFTIFLIFKIISRFTVYRFTVRFESLTEPKLRFGLGFGSVWMVNRTGPKLSVRFAF